MKISLHPLREEDMMFVQEIYTYYTLHSMAVYSITPPTIEELKSFIPFNDPPYRAYVIHDRNGHSVGICYYSRFKPREAFRRSVELTIYFHPDHVGKGYGTEVMKMIEEEIRSVGFKNIMALIDSRNATSLHLFRRFGYRKCACIREVGEKYHELLNLVMVQKLL
ncbi:MAG: GNAT family N-acetyltransferase [Prevotellaceae bacterium]|jgi:phosphinothricin acetyltransferase|nr:GNAT family N-acetyltransferase [Prevotellaceae bacterium]